MLRTFTVIWQRYNSDDESFNYFRCEAESKSHAEEQFYDAEPNGICLWTNEGMSTCVGEF